MTHCTTSLFRWIKELCIFKKNEGKNAVQDVAVKTCCNYGWESSAGGRKAMAAVPHEGQITPKVLNDSEAHLEKEHLLAYTLSFGEKQLDTTVYISTDSANRL